MSNKKVVVISTSLRAGSNSHALAEQFAEGAKSAGHDVKLISLRGKEIKFCIGCGIAGFTNEEIAPLFKAAVAMENVSLPNGWREIIGQQE